MNSLLKIPEIKELDWPTEFVRIPDQQSVPVTPRIRRLMDSPAFQRLAQIQQTGLVSMVYPGATHTRFEHSLGVYRNALCYLQRLAADERFTMVVSPDDAELLIVAALFHDIGHWPFCHWVEDLGLPNLPEHEALVERLLTVAPIRDGLEQDWNIDPQSVVDLLNGKTESKSSAVLASILSGPIDIDKMDYLYRDSLHCGVPYGHHFDRHRLISSLCLNQSGDGIGLTEKGKTAAELMVFARYIMFSEVYWHHAVRSATAMFQRAFYCELEHLDLATVTRMTQPQFREYVAGRSKDVRAAQLFSDLFGDVRKLYKRWAQYSCSGNEKVYQKIARQPYSRLVAISDRLATLLGRAAGTDLASIEVLIDAPPAKAEVQFHVEIADRHQNQVFDLGDVSPVVKSLATRQFDDFVKRVRIFIHPSKAESLQSVSSQAESLLLEAIETA